MTIEPRDRSTQIGVWSALAGGALGFALGMLFAPHRGPDARRRLTYQLESLTAQADDLLQRLTGSGTPSDARRTRDALVADAQQRADRIRDDIDALLDELREQESSAGDASNGTP
jgi:gas vesicle protein